MKLLQWRHPTLHLDCDSLLMRELKVLHVSKSAAYWDKLIRTIMTIKLPKNESNNRVRHTSLTKRIACTVDKVNSPNAFIFSQYLFVNYCVCFFFYLKAPLEREHHWSVLCTKYNLVKKTDYKDQNWVNWYFEYTCNYTSNNQACLAWSLERVKYFILCQVLDNSLHTCPLENILSNFYHRYQWTAAIKISLMNSFWN